MTSSKCVDGWMEVAVTDLFDKLPVGQRYDQKTVSSSGNVPVLDQGRSGVIGYHDNEPGVKASIENPVLTFANHTCNITIQTNSFSVIQNVFPLQAKENTDPYFLYYLIRDSISFQEYKGHWPDFTRLRFCVPKEKRVQTEIGKILGDLDRKIELNRRMNEALEQVGQALFKKYFIDNPDFIELGDIAKIIDCLHSKKPEISNENTGYILLQLNNILDNGILDLTNKYFVCEDDYKNWTSRIEVRENDFVITNVGRCGAVAKIPKGVKAGIGRNMTAIRLGEDFNCPGFVSFTLNSDWMKSQIETKLDQGTILSALNVKSIPKLKLPGSKDLILKYEGQFKLLRSKIESNHYESTYLSSVRDLLLPPLMSGKIIV